MWKALCIVIALVATSCIAQADTVYTNQAAWNAAVSGSTTINFEGIASPSSYVNETPSFQQGGDTFAIGPSAPSGSALFVIGDNFYGYGYAVASSQAASGTLDLRVTLPSPVMAFAFDQRGPRHRNDYRVRWPRPDAVRPRFWKQLFVLWRNPIQEALAHWTSLSPTVQPLRESI
jgi:hypothetical protein